MLIWALLSLCNYLSSILPTLSRETTYETISPQKRYIGITLNYSKHIRGKISEQPRSWLTDGYPSPLMRFLLCLEVEPDLVEPGKPYHKPFAERSVRTLKYECLWVKRPQTWLDARDILETYHQFYNHDRANQSSACNNRPPYEAFPQLPTLPYLPDWVNPDAWVDHYHHRIFKRKVSKSGAIKVDKHTYYVGYQYAGRHVGVSLDAHQLMFKILHNGQIICEREIQGIMGYEMSFNDYLTHMLNEAQTQAD